MKISNEFIDKIIDNQNSEAAEDIMNVLYAKAQVALDNHKKEIASMMIQSTEENSQE